MSCSRLWVTKFDTDSPWYSIRLLARASAPIHTQASISLAITRRSSSARWASASGFAPTSSTTKVESGVCWRPLDCRVVVVSPGVLSLAISGALPAWCSSLPRSGVATLPVWSTIASRSVLFERAMSSDGRMVIDSMSTGSSTVPIQKPLVLTRDRYSRRAMTTTLLTCIVHRLDEDLFEIGFFGAELEDARAPHRLAQDLGAVGVLGQQKLGAAEIGVDGHRIDAGQTGENLRGAVDAHGVGVAAPLAFDLAQLALEHHP